MIKRTQLLLSVILLGTTSFVHAATVTQAKGKQVLVDLEGDLATEGDEFYLINPDTQKKAAIIRIKKTKGEKALGEVLKGTANTGYTLLAKAASAGGSPNESSADGSSHLKTIKDSYGLLGAYFMNSMSANISYTNNATVVKSSTDMSGSGFGIGGFYDYAYSSSIVLRGLAAAEQFSVTGTSAQAGCSGSTNCTANITYLSLYGLGKWYLTSEQFRVWLGAGFGYLLALSKSSSALNESQISTNQVITGALGFDYQLNRASYIPVSLEYNNFPASDTVKASSIVLRVGWAWNL